MDSARYRRLRRSRQCQYRQPYQSSWPAQACWVPIGQQIGQYSIKSGIYHNNYVFSGTQVRPTMEESIQRIEPARLASASETTSRGKTQPNRHPGGNCILRLDPFVVSRAFRSRFARLTEYRGLDVIRPIDVHARGDEPVPLLGQADGRAWRLWPLQQGAVQSFSEANVQPVGFVRRSLPGWKSAGPCRGQGNS